MKLQLIRKYKKSDYTIGNLYIDGIYFCDTIEDTDRNLTDKMSVSEIQLKKVYGKTAIPTGEYEITLNVISPKYSKVDFYKKFANGGRVPRLLNVKGFEGILIHAGNTADDSYGCILIGRNMAKGKVLYSRDTCMKLYPILQEANKRGEKITIEIV